MAYNTKEIIKDVEGNPISQYYNPITDNYEPVEGSSGGNKVVLYNEDGTENNALSLLPILNKLTQLTGSVIDEETRKADEIVRNGNEVIRISNETNRENTFNTQIARIEQIEEQTPQAITDSLNNLSATVGDTTINDTLVPNSDTGVSVQTLLSWLGNMIKSITGKSSWRIKPTKNLEELNTELGSHKAESASKHIAESGSNENGSYVKFDDGTMICIHSYVNTSTVDINVASGALYRSNEQTWIYPATFISAPSLSVNHSSATLRTVYFSGNNVSNGLSGTYLLISNASVSIPAGNIRQSLLAVGRWK